MEELCEKDADAEAGEFVLRCKFLHPKIHRARSAK
jgi:hypothetical protein